MWNTIIIIIPMNARDAEYFCNWLGSVLEWKYLIPCSKSL